MYDWHSGAIWKGQGVFKYEAKKNHYFIFNDGILLLAVKYYYFDIIFTQNLTGTYNGIVEVSVKQYLPYYG
jgi:hypothetical protein